MLFLRRFEIFVESMLFLCWFENLSNRCIFYVVSKNCRIDAFFVSVRNFIESMLFSCRFENLSSRCFFRVGSKICRVDAFFVSVRNFCRADVFFHWVETFFINPINKLFLKRKFYFYWANVGGEGGEKKGRELTSFGFFKEK